MNLLHRKILSNQDFCHTEKLYSLVIRPTIIIKKCIYHNQNFCISMRNLQFLSFCQSAIQWGESTPKEFFLVKNDFSIRKKPLSKNYGAIIAPPKHLVGVQRYFWSLSRKNVNRCFMTLNDALVIDFRNGFLFVK